VYSLEHARNRVCAILELIDQLKQSEFPYTHSRDALCLLEEKFKELYSALRKASATGQSTAILCSSSLYELYLYVPILGFVLRSTNVRNAFEVYAPLLRLARSILGDDTKLIVSSEWEYSPYAYQFITGLPGFVLIGLPAPESANPLLIPLSGHELGHTVWQDQKFSKKFETTIKDRVIEALTGNWWDKYHELYPQYEKSDLHNKPLFTQSTWMPSYNWALLQMEEIFCDFLGLRLFAESYLHAFSYLISPGMSGPRSLSYPNISHRASYLVEAAKKMKVEVFHGFSESFIKEHEPVEPATKLLVAIADEVSGSFVSELIELAQNFADEKAVPQRDTNNVAEICNMFTKKVVPTPKQYPLVDILNAGWKCYQDPNLWEDVSQIKPEDRNRILRDLLLKSMEVSEVYERLGKS